MIFQTCNTRLKRLFYTHNITEHVKGHPSSEIAQHEHPTSYNFEILMHTRNTKIAETFFIQKYKAQHRTLLNQYTGSEDFVLFTSSRQSRPFLAVITLFIFKPFRAKCVCPMPDDGQALSESARVQYIDDFVTPLFWKNLKQMPIIM